MQKHITAGITAPTFKTEDLFGNPIDLRAYQGKPVLLSFFRNAACAICNLRVHQLIVNYPAFEKNGLAIIAVFESPRENMLQYVGKQDAPFPLIANPAGNLYKLYGLEVSEEKIQASMQSAETKSRIQEAAEAGYTLTPEAGSNFYRMPADFLISPEGVVVNAYYSEVLGTHLAFTEIDAYLNTLSPISK
jgi:peroxiredoxin Q/BCP